MTYKNLLKTKMKFLKNILINIKNSEFVKTLLGKSFNNSPNAKRIYNLYKRYPSLFVNKLIKVDLVGGETNFLPYDNYVLDTANTYNHVIGAMPRQSHKSTLGILSALHYAIFNENKNVIIMSKRSSIKDLHTKMKKFMSQVPSWIMNFDKDVYETSDIIRLPNKSTIVFGYSDELSKNSFILKGRGVLPLHICDYFIFDELAFSSLEINRFREIYDEFNFIRTKILILSTRMQSNDNIFEILYKEAINFENDFVPLTIHFRECSYGRTKSDMISVYGENNFKNEFQTYDNV